MRFALSTAPQMCTWPELLATWKAADDIELYESAWTFDHFEPILGHPRQGDCLEGWMTLAALLHSTTRLRGGTLVTGMVYRHPAVLANMAATLDITSGGRLELGLGAGWNTVECGAYGIDLGSVKARCDRFAEGLEVIRLLLSQEQSNFNGEHYQLNDAYCNPKPAQAHLPICIGGSGEKRTLPLVAQYADHWNFGSAAKDPIPELRRKREVLEEQCAAIGRDPSEILISALLFGPALTLEGTVELAHRYAAEGVGLGIVSLPRPMNVHDVERYATALAPLTSE
jgi:F420-dependent oxidoreductase-like protein